MEAIVERRGDLAGTHAREPACCELDGQRDTVQATADGRNRVNVAVIDTARDSGAGSAVDEELHRSRSAKGRDVVNGACRRERVDLIELLARDSQRLAARTQEHDVARRGDETLDQARGAFDHVLAVVEHDEHPRGGEHFDDRLGNVPVRLLRDAERGCDGAGDAAPVDDRTELDEEHGAGECLAQDVRRLDREPGLPDAAGAPERDAALGLEECGDLGDLAVPSQEAGWNRRYAAR